jgi:photosystem II stability/assembly factor-like uncharacterized protein
LLLCFLCGSAHCQWAPLGPEGGDARSLAYDPGHPERVFLGTSAGQLFVSDDRGNQWTRFARVGGSDYVLDHIIIDADSGTMYVSAWSVEHESGDLFRSDDHGLTWRLLPAMHGKSIRALVAAPSDPRTIVAGALDGVFRSRDRGDTWEQISPVHHAEIKNIESLAVDPRDPEVIFAGTWHLPWKTENGGRDWRSIKRGVIDDSDVFSIILDRQDAETVYLSACSGIYKSLDGGEWFEKVQGIPSSAQRTRVLKQDPANPLTIYAGTTGGLWKTTDGGRQWRLVTASNLIVNDVLIYASGSRVLMATDRGGVLASDDGGENFSAANRGFSHRHVSSVLPDRQDPHTLYAGVVGDVEFGGVFVSHDDGRAWQQISSGLQNLDVFTLAQSEEGDILAGAGRGVYELPRNAGDWLPLNQAVHRRVLPAKSKGPRRPAGPVDLELAWEVVPLAGRVMQLGLTPARWYAAGSEGLFISYTKGRSWLGGPLFGQKNFIAVSVSGATVLALAPTAALISQDGGTIWTQAGLPEYVSVLNAGLIAAHGVLWLATREGAFRSRDGGKTWEHVLQGLPALDITGLFEDAATHRLLAVSGAGGVFVSSDEGQSWQQQEVGFAVRSLSAVRGRLLAATAFDGIVAEPEAAAPAPPVSSSR